ncbi:MAG: multiple sugar transport system substrate-binding protein [Thermoanaerobacteraceae bacterium]|nr:multiple sugar transport system substrate-binding protein [Thermoanaerobacteraceae bacterium]
MYRRPFTLFFCLIFVFLMVGSNGCGSDKKSVEPNVKKEWQGVITLWDFPRWPDKNGDRFGWIEKKISEFEKKHPGVFIHLRQLKWEYGLIELKAAAAAGTPPDMAPVAADFDFISAGYLEQVDEYIKPEDIPKYDEKAIEAVSYQGRIYGFPWFITTHSLFLNLEAFSARGAKNPGNETWTYDEFVAALQKLTYDKNRNGKMDYYGFNLFLSPGNFTVWPFLTMDGANIFDENGNFVLNSPEGVSALAKMVDLAAKYKVVPEEDYGTLEENLVWGDFAEKRKIAVYPAGPWAIKVLEDRERAGKGFKFDIAQYPAGQKQPRAFAIVSAYGIFKQEDGAKKELCAEFLSYITSEKEQQALEQYGVFPAIKAVRQKIIEDPFMKKMEKILDDARVLPKVNNLYKKDEILTAQIRMALLAQKTPAQALEDAAREIEKISKNGMTTFMWNK